MSKQDALKIQTCAFKVNIHCDGCQKKVKKILNKIDGVYKTSIDPELGKVTVYGVVDPATIIKKLNKAGKPAELWGSKAGVAHQFQKLSLDGGGKGQHKDAGGGGGGNDAKMVMPQLTPLQLQQLHQQMQLKGLKMPAQFMDAKMPFPAAAAAPAKDPKSVKFSLPEDYDFGDDGSSELDYDDDDDYLDDDGLDEDDLYDDPPMMKPAAAMPLNAGGGDGKKGGNGGKKGGGGNVIPVQIKGHGGGKKDGGGKQNQGGGGGGKNGGGGQPNGKGGAPGGGGNHPGHHPGQGKKGGGGGPAAGIGGLVGGMPPQQAMMRPNMMGQMGGPTGHMGLAHGQHGHPGGGGGGAVQGMPAAGFYQGGGGGGGGGMPEMLQAAAAAGNPMAQQQYMMALMQQQQQQQQQQHHHQQQQQQMMMNGHGHGHGHGGGAYGGYGGYPPAMSYGYGRPPMHYPMHYPMPPHSHAEPYNYFSDENPNSCSVM